MVYSLLHLNKVACTKRGRKGSGHCGRFDVLSTCPYVSRQARWLLPLVLEPRVFSGHHSPLCPHVWQTGRAREFMSPKWPLSARNLCINKNSSSLALWACFVWSFREFFKQDWTPVPQVVTCSMKYTLQAPFPSLPQLPTRLLAFPGNPYTNTCLPPKSLSQSLLLGQPTQKGKTCWKLVRIKSWLKSLHWSCAITWGVRLPGLEPQLSLTSYVTLSYMTRRSPISCLPHPDNSSICVTGAVWGRSETVQLEPLAEELARSKCLIRRNYMWFYGAMTGSLTTYIWTRLKKRVDWIFWGLIHRRCLCSQGHKALGLLLGWPHQMTPATLEGGRKWNRRCLIFLDEQTELTTSLKEAI